VNPYLELTGDFNRGRVRAIVSSGQAVVLHRLSVASKDGDWILREDAESLARVLEVLGARGARYRFGAPLDLRWLRGGWSAHFEFVADGYRVRTDFVTRPPRLAPEDLRALWVEQEGMPIPCVDPARLILLKRTGRERDYAVIGELARRLPEARDRALHGRSPDDLLAMAREEVALLRRLRDERPLLAHALAGDREALGAALDAERRVLMAADAARIARYVEAARPWAAAWPEIQREIAGLRLEAAHRRVVERAAALLPDFAAGGV
jgi:hypothetical protein